MAAGPNIRSLWQQEKPRALISVVFAPGKDKVSYCGMKHFLFLAAFNFVLVFFSAGPLFAQKKKAAKRPKALPRVVSQIGEAALKAAIKPNGKAVFVNFWATWCDPCREEFPDLVKFAQENKEKLDFITVSMDDPADLSKGVTKFLRGMKADKFKNYLIKSLNEDELIRSISPEWLGGLPFSIIYDPSGKPIFAKMGKVKLSELAAAIEGIGKQPSATTAKEAIALAEFIKILNGKREEALFYYENNWKAFRIEALKRNFIHSFEIIETPADADSDFDIILITRYENEAQFKASEANFEPILKEMRPTGPLLKNNTRPEEFRKSVSIKTGTSHFP